MNYKTKIRVRRGFLNVKNSEKHVKMSYSTKNIPEFTLGKYLIGPKLTWRDTCFLFKKTTKVQRLIKSYIVSYLLHRLVGMQ